MVPSTFSFKLLFHDHYVLNILIYDSLPNESDRTECSHIIWCSTVLSGRSLLEAVFKDKQRHFAARSDCAFVFAYLYLCICVCVFVFVYLLEAVFKDKHETLCRTLMLSDCALTCIASFPLLFVSFPQSLQSKLSAFEKWRWRRSFLKLKCCKQRKEEVKDLLAR